MTQADYPGVWVDFNPRGDLQIAGIAHAEYAEDENTGLGRKFTRWIFQGEATFTVVALTNRERDRLFDELVRIIAFGREHPETSEFRDYIESHEFIAMHPNFDNMGQRGFNASPGTPWGSNDVIYEGEVALALQGEFYSDLEAAGTLAPLSQIRGYPYLGTEGDPDPWDDDESEAEAIVPPSVVVPRDDDESESESGSA